MLRWVLFQKWMWGNVRAEHERYPTSISGFSFPVPAWTSPAAAAFAAIQLVPWRLRVFPGTVLLGQGGSVLTWRSED